MPGNINGDIKFATMQFALDTGLASQDIFTITIPDFGTPAGVVLSWTQATADDTDTADAQMGFGFAAYGSEPLAESTTTMIEDGVTTMNSNRYQDSNALVNIGSAGTLTGRAQLSSFIKDGISCRVDTVFSSAILINVLFIGEAGVTEAGLYLRDLGADTGISTVWLNFEPDLAFVKSVGLSDGTLSAGDPNYSFGVTVNNGASPIQQNCIGFATDDGAATENAGSIISDSSILQMFVEPVTGTPAINYTIDVDNFSSDGFQVNMSDDAGNAIMYTLGIRFKARPNLWLGNMTWPTSGDYAETGPGFEGLFGMNFALVGASAMDTVNTDDFNVSTMWFDDTGTYTLNFSVEDNVGTSNASSRNNLSANIRDGVAALEVAATFDGFDATGLDFSITTNPGTAVQGFTLVVGGVAQNPRSPQGASPQGVQGANFRNNTIVASDPGSYPEVVPASPANPAYLWTSNPGNLVDNLFLFPGIGFGHAVGFIAEGEFDVAGNIFSDQWLDGTSPDGNGTSDAGLFNDVGQVILNLTGGASTPTFTDKQSPGTAINNNISVTITGLEEFTEVRVYLAEDSTSPIDTNEIAGVEDSGSPSEFTFTAPAGTLVDIVVFNVDYLLPPNNRIKNYTVPTTDTSFPISQIPDRNFANP